MTAKTKTFVAGALFVVVTGLGIGAVSYYGGWSSVMARQAAPEELRYVPASATLVAFVDIRELMAAGLADRLRGQPGGPALEEVGREVGIDLERDLDHVVVAMWPSGGRSSGVDLVRGRFDQVALEAAARARGGVVADYKGTRLVRLVRGSRPGSDAVTVLAFPEPGLLVVGDEPAVHQVIDVQRGAAGLFSKGELTNLVAGVDTAAHIWAVGRFETLAGELPQGLGTKVPGLRTFSASGRFDTGLVGVVKAEARDAAAARNLLDMANGLLALARAQSGERPELQALLQGVALSGSGTQVEVALNLPPQALDTLTRFPRSRGSRVP